MARSEAVLRKRLHLFILQRLRVRVQLQPVL